MPPNFSLLRKSHRVLCSSALPIPTPLPPHPGRAFAHLLWSWGKGYQPSSSRGKLCTGQVWWPLVFLACSSLYGTSALWTACDRMTRVQCSWCTWPLAELPCIVNFILPAPSVLDSSETWCQGTGEKPVIFLTWGAPGWEVLSSWPLLPRVGFCHTKMGAEGRSHGSNATNSHCFWQRFSKFFEYMFACSGVQPFGVSGPHWKEKSCLGSHVKHTNTNENWWIKKKVLSKPTILCWAAFIAILGHTRPVAAGRTPLDKFSAVKMASLGREPTSSPHGRFRNLASLVCFFLQLCSFSFWPGGANCSLPVPLFSGLRG